MYKPYSDHTFEHAMGNVNKEWKEMARLALIIRDGRCNPVWADEQMHKFTGIFKRLLEDPIEEVKEEAGGRSFAERD